MNQHLNEITRSRSQLGCLQCLTELWYFEAVVVEQWRTARVVDSYRLSFVVVWYNIDERAGCVNDFSNINS